MKRILVPTDFSSCANNAVDFAVQSAKMVPLEVFILHSYEIVDNLYSDYVGLNKEFNRTMLSDLTNKLDQLRDSILEKDGVSVKTLLYTDSLQESLSKACDQQNIDLIVMGTLGASGIKEKLWGSKTANVIGKSQIPVLTIPHDYKWQPPSKILLATNHFDNEPAIFDFIFDLVDLYNAELSITVFTGEDDDEAIEYLETGHKIPAFEKMLKRTYKMDALQVSHLYGKDFEETLQAYINENRFDMVIMITHHRGFLESIFHSSKTKRMAYHTSVPLLAIPELKREEAT